jgi:hypothetical protein
VERRRLGGGFFSEGVRMPVLTDQQRKFYESTLEITRAEIGELKDQIEEELSKVKDRIAELQTAINASKQMYAAACSRLGLPNDLEDEESADA